MTSSPNTLRNSAAQSSLRASIIAVGCVFVLAASAAVGCDETTRERHAWAEDSTPWNRVV